MDTDYPKNTEETEVTCQNTWTVMIYLAGHNNLSDDMVWALKEIQKVGSTDCVTILAQMDSPRRDLVCPEGVLRIDFPVASYDNNRCDLVRFRKDIPLGDAAHQKVGGHFKNYPKVIADFIRWGIDYAPADHYMVVLSGHGRGTAEDFLSREENAPEALSIPELQYIFSLVKYGRPVEEAEEDERRDVLNVASDDGFKLDILGLDSCMMSMAEVAYELRHYIKYLIGAEGLEANSGWPYQQILSYLTSQYQHGQSGITPECFSKKIVEIYVKYYFDYLSAARSVDLAACDVQQWRKLRDAIDWLGSVLDKHLSYAHLRYAIVLAHWEAQAYKFDLYTDICDFCDLLIKHCEPYKGEHWYTVVEGACKDVLKVILGDGQTAYPFVLKSCYVGAAFQYSFGLSVYFPWSGVSTKYRHLDFARDTHWDEFLYKYVTATRRRKREPVNFVDIILSDPGVNRDAPPHDKGDNSEIGSMKNPPTDWVPGEWVKNCANNLIILLE